MKKELETKYNPQEMEDRIYKKWQDEKYFEAVVDKSKKPYSIVMPPPNVTGVLHIGHALNNSLQDILIRWKRMQGYSVLWVPGTDHASISTEVKVVDKLLKEGIKKTDITREEFLKEAWDWTHKYGGTIVSQLRKLGVSCDWSRERFTMDEMCSKAVLESFVKLYEKGYIYRGERITNWCPHCKTTISDAEVEYEEVGGKFYHIKYMIEGTDEFLQVATTRPETMFGDTAVAVNPNDTRYKKYVGKNVILPITNKKIPVVADEHADMEFGTGVVKITPGHDLNDFEVGKRKKLPIVICINDDGTMNKNAMQYEGMDRYECRKQVVKDLETQGLLVKAEEHIHNVGTHDRCKIVIEPIVKMQWFVAMEELVKPAIRVVKTDEVHFVTERYEKIYMHWLENIRDWCISRQLWWGHRIPAYYCDDCGEITVSMTTPSKCNKCSSSNLKQDEDVLDTWFSSALWPFSTMGWPDKTEDLEFFYPTDVLITGPDIIFFWVARMVFSGLEYMDKIPFKDVLINGIVRDSEGRKMSKSLGNGIDPIDVVEKYGADAMRFMLVSNNTPGNDMRFYWDKVEASRNFANKIWNATRFIMINMDEEMSDINTENLTISDKWILSRVNTLAKEVTENMEKYDLGVGAQKIQDFLWSEYCDWYVEMVKPRLYNKEDETRHAALWTLKTVLINALKLLHPYMPFITEEIFTTLQDTEETIVHAKWPEYNFKWNFASEEEQTEIIKDIVKGIRNARLEKNIVPSRKIRAVIVTEDRTLMDTIEKQKDIFNILVNTNEISVLTQKNTDTDNAISIIVKNAIVYLPLKGLIDFDQEIERLGKEKERLEKEIERIDVKLANEGFVAKAPAKVIEEEKEKRNGYKNMLGKVSEEIKSLEVNK
ncbi:MAG TPA: valine--tRNA ligase [Clostridiales bacterium]|nr:MAG: valine--tRNA ligase [Clostridiales bacterium GWD2_32_19]HCC06864.1 valine--tRNA ligase [Clostridiales bacterium]